MSFSAKVTYILCLFCGKWSQLRGSYESSPPCRAVLIHYRFLSTDNRSLLVDYRFFLNDSKSFLHSFWPAQTHTQANQYTRTQALKHIYTHAHAHTRTLYHAHTHIHMRVHAHTRTSTQAHTFSPSLTHTPALSLAVASQLSSLDYQRQWKQIGTMWHNVTHYNAQQHTHTWNVVTVVVGLSTSLKANRYAATHCNTLQAQCNTHT